MGYKVEVKCMHNDLFWNFCKLIETDKGYEFFDTTWEGYNDSNWWDNVAPLKKTRTATVTGDKGTVKTFQINFSTGEVEEVEEKENDR